MTWAKRSGVLLALAGFVLAALAMLAARAGAVVFGAEVLDGGQSAPWVASIWYSESADGDPEFICTGSLIADDIVLTAAHCTFNTGFYWIRLGSDTLESDVPLIKEIGRAHV